MYENYGNAAINQTPMNAKSQSPVMQDLIQVFEKELAGFNELTLKIKGQVQNIYRGDEPTGLIGSDKMQEPNDTISKLRSLIKLVGEYNQRLVDISNHLAKIA